MYKKTQKFDMYKYYLTIVFLLSVIISIFFGILVGQRNAYNSFSPSQINIKNEKGSSTNILSIVKKSAIWGLGKDVVSEGDAQYYIDSNILNMHLVLSSARKSIQLTETKIDIPKKVTIFASYEDDKGDDYVYDEIGKVELIEGVGGYNLDFYTQITIKDKLPKQIIIKATDTSEDQNIYLYNDNSVPTKVNGKPMPFYIIKIIN